MLKAAQIAGLRHDRHRRHALNPAHGLKRRDHQRHGPIRHQLDQRRLQPIQAFDSRLHRVQHFLIGQTLCWMREVLPVEPTLVPAAPARFAIVSAPIKLFNCDSEDEQIRWAVDHLKKGGWPHDIALWLGGADHPRRTASPPAAGEETPGGFGTAPALHQDIEHVAVLVDRRPEIALRVTDAQKHLIPQTTCRPASLQCVGKQPAEAQAPIADALVGHDDAPGSEPFFSIAAD